MRQLQPITFGIFIISFAATLLLALLSIITNMPGQDTSWF